MPFYKPNVNFVQNLLLFCSPLLKKKDKSKKKINRMGLRNAQLFRRATELSPFHQS